MQHKLIDKLFIKPRKEKGVEMAHFPNYEPMQRIQCDILYLPNDEGYRYLLVCKDIKSKLFDVYKFKEIFNGDILDYPMQIDLDNGFNHKNIIRFFDEKDIKIKFSNPYRHKQMAPHQNSTAWLTDLRLLSGCYFSHITQKPTKYTYLVGFWVIQLGQNI